MSKHHGDYLEVGDNIVVGFAGETGEPVYSRIYEEVTEDEALRAARRHLQHMEQRSRAIREWLVRMGKVPW